MSPASSSSPSTLRQQQHPTQSLFGIASSPALDAGAGLGGGGGLYSRNTTTTTPHVSTTTASATVGGAGKTPSATTTTDFDSLLFNSASLLLSTGRDGVGIGYSYCYMLLRSRGSCPLLTCTGRIGFRFGRFGKACP